MAVRDFLNEGGKLAYAGETAGVLRASAATDRRHLLRPRRRPEEDCVVTVDPLQRLPAAGRRLHPVLPRRLRPHAARRPTACRHRRAARGVEALFGGPARSTTRSTRPARSRRRATSCRPTSSRSSRAGRPRTTSTPSGRSSRSRASWAAARDARRRQLPCAWRARSTSPASRAADTPTFEAQFSCDTEEGYDHVIVEAHTVGPGRLDDAARPQRRHHRPTVPAECEAGLPARASIRSWSTTSRSGTRACRRARPGRGTRSPARRRLGAGGVRPQRLRRAAGRGRRSATSPTRSPGRRAHRRRHQARRRRERRPRPRASRPGFGAWTVLGPARGQPRQRRATSSARRPRRHRGRHGDARHAAPRLRPRAARVGCRTRRRGRRGCSPTSPGSSRADAASRV